MGPNKKVSQKRKVKLNAKTSFFLYISARINVKRKIQEYVPAENSHFVMLSWTTRSDPAKSEKYFCNTGSLLCIVIGSYFVVYPDRIYNIQISLKQEKR